MVELQENIARYLPRNLSYTGNYHSFYWPVLVRCCSCCRSTRNNYRQGMQGSNSAEAKPAYELKTEDFLPGQDMVPSRAECKAMRTLSTVSDSDTTFSEDYTRMTETSNMSESAESDFSTPTGSVCSDLEDSLDMNTLNRSEATLFTEKEPSSSGESCDTLVKQIRAKPKLVLDTANAVPDPAEAFEDKPEQTNSLEEKGVSQENSFGSGSFEDQEFEFLSAEPVRRSTSLKTYKTPPGTPSRKKVVRFADALGLDLESVRHVLNLDTPPEIPASAVKDLKIGVEEFKATEGNRYLTACFKQPGGEPNFHKRVLAEYVCLENCMIDDKMLTLTGTIKVANVHYHKYVTVRYTVNNWITNDDVCASYVANSNDGPTDRFSFNISIPQYFGVGNKLEFAIRYATGGQEYWDNNKGNNYTIECFARSVPIRDSDTEWIHFL